MQYRRTLALVSLLLIVLLALAGCAPRAGAGESAAAAGPDQLVVDLPAIAIDVAEDGSISLAGSTVEEIVAGFGVELPFPLNFIEPSTVQQLVDANIQHLQLVTQPDGLRILVNGQEIPSIGYSGEELASLTGLAGDQPALQKLIPLLTQLGVGVTLRLPVAEGVDPIPLQVEGVNATRLVESQQAFLEEAGSTPTISIPLVYNEDGSFTLGSTGVSSDDLIGLTGQSMWGMLLQRPEQIQWAMENDIETMSILIDADGLRLSIDGTRLPGIDWSEGRLTSGLQVLAESGLVDLPIDAATLQGFVDSYLPMLTASNLSIVATFPES